MASAEVPSVLADREEHVVDEPGIAAREVEDAVDLVVGQRIAEQFGRAIADVGRRQVLQHEVRALPAESIDEPGHGLRARPRPEGDDDVRSVRRASGS